MTARNGKAKEIALGDDFGDVVVKANGARIEISAGGHVAISTAGTVIVKPGAANDDLFIPTVASEVSSPRELPRDNSGSDVSQLSRAKAALRIGDPDGGGVYVGKSATTRKDLHAALADEPEYLSFSEAFAAAGRMKKIPGRENAHVPTPEELNVNLYQNKDAGALKGTFNTSGSFPADCYRSSASDDRGDARVQFFGNGNQIHYYDLFARLPVRLVW